MENVPLIEAPLISVLIIFRNEEKYLSSCIDSVLNQTFKNFEIVLVDDNSTDSSVATIQRFKDNRIKLVSIKELNSGGRPMARNIALQHASGDVIAILDADDTYEPKKLEKQWLKLSELGKNYIVGTEATYKSKRNGILKVPEFHNEIVAGFNREYKRINIVYASIMFYKEILRDYTYLNKFKYQSDYDLFLRLYESGKIYFYNIQEPLYNYWIRDKGTIFQKDWFKFNIFIRDCKYRRRKGLPEFDSPDKMYDFLIRNNIPRYLYYKVFENILKVKKKLY